jgi:hypothetical protein
MFSQCSRHSASSNARALTLISRSPQRASPKAPRVVFKSALALDCTRTDGITQRAPAEAHPRRCTPGAVSSPLQISYQ